MNINPSTIEIVIVAHTRHALLQAALTMWAETLKGYAGMYVIANHPTTMDGIVLPSRTTAVQTGRTKDHVGQLSQSWNLGFQWTFCLHPETQWVICSQDDVKVAPGWLDVVNTREAHFYNAPAGDMIMLISRHAFKVVGWFDEHIRTIGGHDMDWIARAVHLLGKDQIVSEDNHGWCYNPIGLVNFWESAGGKATPGGSYKAGDTLDKIMKEYLLAKWGISSVQLKEALIAHKIPNPVQKEYDWYPWCPR